MAIKRKTIVLAYSGGLDTSVILHWLKENYNADIVAYIANLGQQEDLKAIAKRAKKVGAAKVYVEDLRNEFVKEFVFPMIQASSIYEGSYLLGPSIARPLIARRQIQIAKKEGRLSPPGHEVYRDLDQGISLFEVDGAVDKIFCQGLVLPTRFVFLNFG